MYDSGKYVSAADDAHERAEELQWAELLGRGSVSRGMILVLVQKLCTAFHEYGPAYREEILPQSVWPFVRERLCMRIRKVLDTAAANGLENVGGMDDLRSSLEELAAAHRMPDLEQWAERIHKINHAICESLVDAGGEATLR